ncbi:MAG: tripartite tricarboxylate transporter TctB family protein [Roseobacter sp.]
MSDMSLPRLQHIIASGCVAAVGICVAYLSYTQQPSEAFLFPRLISTVFVVLALWTFAKACLGWTKVGAGVSGSAFLNMLPGLGVALIYVFWAAKGLGFYTATTITFFILVSLYDPAPHNVLKSWIKRAAATVCFIAVMYGLFAVLLKVYTPREILF